VSSKKNRLYDPSQVENLLESGKADEALTVLQSVSADNPEQATLHYQLGEAFYQKGQWKEACQAYLKAVSLQPDMVQASIGFGDASVELKAYLEAEKAYRYALQQDASVLSQIALCYKNMGDMLASDLQGELAYKSYYNAFDLDDSLLPDIQVAFTALSESLQQAGQLEYAQQAKVQADRLGQELEAQRLLEAEQVNDALPLLHEAVMAEPKRAVLHYRVGKAYCLLQEWKSACEAYLQALNLKPNMLEAAIGFAEASVELQAYAEAEKALEHVLKQLPSAGEQVALVYKRIGDKFAAKLVGEQAQTFYKKALALDASLSSEVLNSLVNTLNGAERNLISSDKASFSEENELLLLQLHQVQEELEKYFLKNQSLEAKLQDTEAKLQDTEAKLQDTEAKLQDTEAKLQDTETKLQNAETNLRNIISEKDSQIQKLEIDNIHYAQQQEIVDKELIKAEAQLEIIKNIFYTKFNINDEVIKK